MNEDILTRFDEKFVNFGMGGAKEVVRQFIVEVVVERDEWWLRTLQPCQDYCRKQNGRNDCKNCGLDLDIIRIKLKSLSIGNEELRTIDA